jgi:hypothetical protein
MVSEEEDDIKFNHFACFGGIIHSFARLEWVIQGTMRSELMSGDLLLQNNRTALAQALPGRVKTGGPKCARAASTISC